MLACGNLVPNGICGAPRLKVLGLGLAFIGLVPACAALVTNTGTFLIILFVTTLITGLVIVFMIGDLVIVLMMGTATGRITVLVSTCAGGGGCKNDLVLISWMICTTLLGARGGSWSGTVPGGAADDAVDGAAVLMTLGGGPSAFSRSFFGFGVISSSLDVCTTIPVPIAPFILTAFGPSPQYKDIPASGLLRGSAQAMAEYSLLTGAVAFSMHFFISLR